MGSRKSGRFSKFITRDYFVILVELNIPIYLCVYINTECNDSEKINRRSAIALWKPRHTSKQYSNTDSCESWAHMMDTIFQKLNGAMAGILDTFLNQANQKL